MSAGVGLLPKCTRTAASTEFAGNPCDAGGSEGAHPVFPGGCPSGQRGIT